MKQSLKRVTGPIGVGAAACAACCAGPILALVGGLGLAGGAAALAFGAIVLAAALVVTGIAAFAVRRRRRGRRTSCGSGSAVPLAPPTLRSSA